MAEHPRIQRLFLFDEGDMSLRDFVELSPGQLTDIAQFVDRQGFSGERDEVLNLAEKIGRSYEKTADILQYAGYLFGEQTRLGLTPDDILVEFETFLERKGQSELKEKLLRNFDRA